MDTKTILNDASARMQKAVDHLEEELLNIRAGKASPNVLNGVMVDYFGSQVPVSGAASVTVPDAKTILIQPWDKNMLRPIEKAILDSNIGLTPSNNGETIRLTIPPLTEERRKGLVKQVRSEAETARVSLRNARRDAVEAFKRAQKEGMPEDESKDGETQAQKLLEKFTKALDEAVANKEKDIMTVWFRHARGGRRTPISQAGRNAQIGKVHHHPTPDRFVIATPARNFPGRRSNSGRDVRPPQNRQKATRTFEPFQ